MGGFKDIEEAREYFSNDRFATENGMTIDELDTEHSVCSMTLSARHRNAYGGVMGGAIFTLADFAFATLTNDRERITVAQQVSVNYLAAPEGVRPGGATTSPAGARTGAPPAWWWSTSPTTLGATSPSASAPAAR